MSTALGCHLPYLGHGEGCCILPPLGHPRSLGVVCQAHGEGHETGSNTIPQKSKMESLEVRQSKPITFACCVLGSPNVHQIM